MLLNGFQAWITIEGEVVQEYGQEIFATENQATCWIPSELGKEFQIHWKDHSYSVPTTGRVGVDGTLHGGKLIYEGSAPRFTTRKRGFRESSTRLFPFVFSKLGSTGTYLDNIKGLGEISLTIWRVRLIEKLETYKQPRSSPVEKNVVHETMKKGIDHRAGLSSSYIYRPGIPQIAVEPYGEPVVQFCFRYRPLDVLQAKSIMPRTIQLSDNGTNLLTGGLAQIKQQVEDRGMDPQIEDKSKANTSGTETDAWVKQNTSVCVKAEEIKQEIGIKVEQGD
ncbi:hypothetical protein K435DRAFT_969657 [Dendrothele bispora CBS 962.96]|uniref:DUF7918 domain-containing protein n=1 Tax=Dendrothele bispora (strain CBS 962.96) TaxID=1314807 RepID=A0A4S8LGS3_DENBC|nr:hypothetical protein K435DRAFT_969657 [Dendrothele bispora CBS 962.96]